ncbi:MAG: DUF4113 domain-containing protein [Planctomycetes bacterium]|nr:DUF4113 domain-containing protein [Planctomycetota bacterium]
MLHRLIPRARIHPNLFDPRDHACTHRLMQVMDRINHDQGRGAIRIGAAAAFELMPGRTVAWKGRCERRSHHHPLRYPCTGACLMKGNSVTVNAGAPVVTRTDD